MSFGCAKAGRDAGHKSGVVTRQCEGGCSFGEKAAVDIHRVTLSASMALLIHDILFSYWYIHRVKGKSTQVKTKIRHANTHTQRCCLRQLHQQNCHKTRVCFSTSRRPLCAVCASEFQITWKRFD